MDYVKVCAWIIFVLLVTNVLFYPYLIQTKYVKEYTAGGFIIFIIVAIPEFIIIGRVLGWW